MKKGVENHPQMLSFVDLLNKVLPCEVTNLIDTKTTAMGYISMLFCSMALEAKHGAIGIFTNHQIALRCGWKGNPDLFIRLLLDCGWLVDHADYRLISPGWHRHNEDYVNTWMLGQRQLYACGKIPRMTKANQADRAGIIAEYSEIYNYPFTEAHVARAAGEMNPFSRPAQSAQSAPCHSHSHVPLTLSCSISGLGLKPESAGTPTREASAAKATGGELIESKTTALPTGGLESFPSGYDWFAIPTAGPVANAPTKALPPKPAGGLESLPDNFDWFATPTARPVANAPAKEPLPKPQPLPVAIPARSHSLTPDQLPEPEPLPNAQPSPVANAPAKVPASEPDAPSPAASAHFADPPEAASPRDLGEVEDSPLPVQSPSPKKNYRVVKFEKRGVEPPEGCEELIDHWANACECARLVETMEFPPEGKCAEPGGRTRAVAFAYLADQMVRKMRAPWPWMLNVVMAMGVSSNTKVREIWRQLRQFPDGAYPGDGKPGSAPSQKFKGKGGKTVTPCRLEEVARLLAAEHPTLPGLKPTKSKKKLSAFAKASTYAEASADVLADESAGGAEVGAEDNGGWNPGPRTRAAMGPDGLISVESMRKLTSSTVEL